MIAVIIVLYHSEGSNYDNLIGKANTCVILVDNTVKRDLGISGKSLYYIPLKENYGIATAQNIGIRKAMELGCSHIVFFDQDSVIEPNYVDEIVEEYAHMESCMGNLFLLGPTVFNGRTGDEYKSVLHKDDVASNGFIPRQEIISSGSCVGATKVGTVGRLCERLFIDYVDFEWCWRANKMGFVSGITSNVRLRHFVGQREFKVFNQLVIISSPFRYFYQYRNYLWLLRKSYVPFLWKVNTGIKFIFRIFYFPFCIQNWWQIEYNMWKGIWHGLFKYDNL